jgi:CheY-like chemotaxis protein/DNA-binding HxlR family transcriptional regulator
VKVLVVDDDRVLRETFSSLLEDEGYSVGCASNGVEALHVLQKEKYDITFLDLKMPKLNGLELLSKIKEEGIDTIPIMITGYATIESAVEAMRNGAYDYVQKPFEMKRIREAIGNALSERSFKNGVSTAFDKVDPFALVKELSKNLPALSLTTVGDTRCKANPNVNCVYVGEKDGDIHARDLYRVSDVITIFAKKNPKSLVFINCLGELLTAHEWKDIFGVISKLILELSPTGVRFVIALDPESVDREPQQDLIHLVTEKHIQPISNCLANPIRRDIIRILKKERKAPFSVIMHGVGEIESPKLSFHLRRLLTDGIIAKDGEEYKLTTSGYLISETLDTLEFNLAKDPQGAITLFYGY